MSMVDLPLFTGDQSIVSCDDSEESSCESGLVDNVPDDSTTDRSSTRTVCNKEDNDTVQQTILHKENAAVKRSKYIFLLAIVILAVTLGLVAAKLAKESEQRSFQQQFETLAYGMLHSFQRSVAQSITTSRAVSSQITVYAKQNGLVFPNVTIPDFALLTKEAQKLSGTDLFAILPLVAEQDRAAWEAFALANHQWVYSNQHEGNTLGSVPERIHDLPTVINKGNVIDDALTEQDYFLPFWQTGSLVANTTIINGNMLYYPAIRRQFHILMETRTEYLSDEIDLTFLHEAIHVEHLDFAEEEYSFDSDHKQPHTVLLTPIFQSIQEDGTGEIAAFVLAVFPWGHFFENTLAEETATLRATVNSSCSGIFTFEIQGEHVAFIGYGDHHHPSYEHIGIEVEISSAPFKGDGVNTTWGGLSYSECHHTLTLFPTSQLEATQTTNRPAIYAAAVIAVFTLAATLFVIYDHAVITRQKKLLLSAQRTNAIVASLFPKTVQDRILEQADYDTARGSFDTRYGRDKTGNKKKISSFLNGEADPQTSEQRPIADLFPKTTILFADIVGFTAWSSTREPFQVFELLETIYKSFDDIARKRRVFKVETVGDCYVAAAGLPEPRSDHAVIMARFASDCLAKFATLTKAIETSLGPDTSDLGLRIGIHSGPVTAGVLRGERARFQLFGDTMNTTARIETAGQRNKIHVSETVADLLVAAGKGHWLTRRDDLILAKGKGEMQTYWLEIKSVVHGSTTSGSTSSDKQDEGQPEHQHDPSHEIEQHHVRDEERIVTALSKFNDKTQRLIDWNTDLLAKLVIHIVTKRGPNRTCSPTERAKIRALECKTLSDARKDKHVLDEVQEIIALPEFVPNAEHHTDHTRLHLTEEVMAQLRQYCSTVAALYRGNPFHNFEHASHVAMSVAKLLSRIVAPDLDVTDHCNADANLHDHTYGITSDPLTQFSVLLSALIHDVDHSGVPNSTLVQEKTGLAIAYKCKSVAEQNSVDIAWDLLMDDSFCALREALYASTDEFTRFRALVVNSVMATDIMDKELGAFRKARWTKAFDECNEQDTKENATNRKATIVIEHLIQASDVSHTMQHWHIFQKWNERLFEEMHVAYKAGRSPRNPADTWYESELGFFDYYVIPLAKKLEDCGVFGVASDEYLHYAQRNRAEWEAKGREIVERYLQKYGQPCVD